VLVWKLFRPAEWAALEAAGETAGAPVDRADGFIHLSTAEQVRETARRHFAAAGPLILAGAEAEALGAALRWEPSRGGALFPHLYRRLRRDEIAVWHRIGDGPEGHVLPDGFP
jgi:uncharacterized protein (DUF952 family)